MSNVYTLTLLKEKESEVSNVCINRVNDYINSLSDAENTIDIVECIMKDVNHPIHADLLSIVNDRDMFNSFVCKLDLSDRDRACMLSFSNGIAAMSCDVALKDYTINNLVESQSRLESENELLKQELSSRNRLSDEALESILSSSARFHKRKILSKVDVYKRFGLSY
ncbi:ORF3 [Circoviridae TaCV2]|uniref:ORF3 n=1 Tax=Circoviridae TaCV2 TaxID=2094725 RepID=A0A2L2P5L7_9VIRU|nr:ORF3 [Circoviridae TaCV2]